MVCEKLNFNKHACSELDWILMQSDKSILFYDKNQSIKPSDVKKEDFDLLKLKNNTNLECLKSQFRVKGGNDYVRYIDSILNCSLSPQTAIFNSKEYEFILFDSMKDLTSQIKLRESENGLSRLIAGFSWPWISKNDKTLYDIKIEGEELQWNRVADDWINSPNAINEVGCINTTQGYDLNYTGIIFGNEITFDKEKNEIAILKQNYFDRNGQVGIVDINDLKEFIVNIYKTIMLRGIKGTYIYACDKNLREYFAKHIAKYKEDKPSVIIPKMKVLPFVNSVPLYDLKVAAGDFSGLQTVSDCVWVEIPPRYRPSSELFACTVIGESMNKIIPSGSICLFRKDMGGSRNGKIVLVQCANFRDSDFGSGYTVKEYRSKKNVSEGIWGHESISLKPLSWNSEYSEIELTVDDLDDFKVVGIFECVL